MSHYGTLGVKPRATAEEIKTAYRKAAREHHPDRGGDPKQFQRINEAYKILGDETKRPAYDENRRKSPLGQLRKIGRAWGGAPGG